ncbi:MAG: cadmium-translocating P-type ATPase [Bacilli bacterium]|nr:cadmium-translocating P-type ATPase [Bacilli bacterium]
MEVKKYQITKMNSVKGINRIVNEIKKIDTIFNASIDRTTKILIIECNAPEQEFKQDNYYKKLEDKILKAIKMYEKHAKLVSIDNVEVYRKVLYLNGLDCAYCGTRIENIAKKELNHQRIVVDYPTYRFIIETTDKALVDNLESRVTEIAHKVDERIKVQSAEKGKPRESEIEKTFKKPQVIVIWIGIVIFLIGILTSHILKSNNILGVILVVIGYFMIGHQIILRFFKNLLKGRIFDENFLMTVASIGALITKHYEEAAVVMLLYQFGEFLQNIAVNRTRKSIADLLSYEVQTVKLKLGEEVSEVGVEGVLTDDVIVVSKGEMIPVDGKVCKGKTYLDTKNITGESRARSVDVGDEVMSGSLNIGNIIEVRVTRTYNNSMMTRILDLVENATINKSKAENFITKFSRYYTPIVVFIAALILTGGVVASFINKSVDWTDWVYVAMEFLVISCPCALVISVPLSFFCAIGVASKRGILIRGSNYLEAMYHVENIVFDKTGTLTKGEFNITEIVPAEGYRMEDVKRLFIYTEYYSEHPIGKSVVEAYGKENVLTEIISEFQPLQGGARAVINGSHILIATNKLAKREKLTFPEVLDPNLVVYVFKEKTYIGYVVVGDTIREEAFDTLSSLRQGGISKTYMLTGDTKAIAENVANMLQIDEVFSDLLPDQKVEYMDKIKESTKSKLGTTAYVGDGINDAPVIASSDVGIAMGDTASDATISISDIVIMTNDLNKLVELQHIAKKTRHKVVENIVFALGIKVIVMIIALVLHGDAFTMSLWLAIFSDVGVSLLAILNSLRLMRMFGKQLKIDQGEKEDDEE